MGIYRPNVAALIRNQEGRILICERISPSGAWQFPQGGVDDEEDLETAISREIEEEVGLKKTDYEIVGQKGGYRYDFPEEVRKRKVGRKAQFVGQEQTYFLCQLRSDASEIDLTQEPREFSQARWILPEQFQIDWLPEFKRETYRQVLSDFFEVNLA